MADQDTPPPTITAMKIPIIKKGEYDIWSMRMRQYICHTDHNLWDIIVNGDLEDEATPSGEQSSPPVPKTAKQLAARRNQERIKSILLLAIPDEYLLKFHNVPDAKSLWAAIKSRFGGNEESKKMQKNVLKHQFENFVTASNETLDKAYDRFQKLISQLEIHGAYVSKEDINQKFLRSLPPSWSQIALIMRNKPDIDEVDIDDLYNNLRVYEDELKRSSGSNSASQNLAFLSSSSPRAGRKGSQGRAQTRRDTSLGLRPTGSCHFGPPAPGFLPTGHRVFLPLYLLGSSFFSHISPLFLFLLRLSSFSFSFFPASGSSSLLSIFRTLPPSLVSLFLTFLLYSPSSPSLC
ncbi:hypothetical protein Tco_0046413 [Tanacetum coccineum]